MKALLVNPVERNVSWTTLAARVLPFGLSLLDPKAVRRMPNGDSLWAGTDRITRDAFSFGRSKLITGIGVLVGKKYLAGDFGSARTL